MRQRRFGDDRTLRDRLLRGVVQRRHGHPVSHDPRDLHDGHDHESGQPDRASFDRLDRLFHLGQLHHVGQLVRRKVTMTNERREAGQVLVLFAIALTAILIALALLFDGAQSLVLRRQLQNSADSGALAGANIVQNGTCTSVRVSSTATDGSNDIYLAVRAKIVQNLGWTTARAEAALTVTCATDQSWYQGYAVTVTLNDTSPTDFGASAGTQQHPRRGITKGFHRTSIRCKDYCPDHDP